MPMTEHRPVVPSTVSLPEITVKAVVLSVVLAALLAAANAYLGLFAGMTVSASIPAAVTSMAVLRLFRRSNILENNIVQTAVSAGEALAAGVIFTIPALLLVGSWSSFDYWRTTVIAMVGGLLGVLFTIPLRRALIVTAQLRFPEGVATAEVLKAGAATPHEAGRAVAHDVRVLLFSALAGGATKFCESGLRLWAESLEGAVRIGRTLFYGGINLSPALLAVGFILGLRTALVVFLGGCLGWVVLVPAHGLFFGVPTDRQGIEAAMAIWSGKVRYVGIGAMVVGGLWTLAQLRAPVWQSLQVLWARYREAGTKRRRGEPPGRTTVENREGKADATARTERDAPFWWLVAPFVLLLIPAAWIYATVVDSVAIGLFMTLVMTVAAFLFSSVAAYMAGLVGSSSNPVSGVTIATIMAASLLLVLFMGAGHPAGPAAALVIGAVVCCAAAMGGDNMQDLKTGHLVGATPWKQQVMQVVGVLAGAVVLAPVLTVLQAKYGIGAPTSDHPHPLSAPQATLMASLAHSVFGGAVPWPLVGAGAVIGGLVILLDQRQERRGRSFRLPILAVALGIYLPLKLSAAIVAGGVVAALAERARESGGAGEDGARRGLLFSAGLVTGESLMGILLALPVALGALWPGLGSDPFALFDRPPLGGWPGLLMMALVVGALYRSVTSGHSATSGLGRR
ncbi:Oligopeptide transporter [Candidatus Nitrospira inopinata]|uniref:Oligopeptide transporter n=2 Tax=Candidatus Nitrospira inopinata TaxID=1715989 RepID=A0A0S4KPN8_9BACT|nr:Oligopeptide transporter [Candidatus Nitrospira inopinata]